MSQLRPQRQRQLFDQPLAAPAVRLRLDVQERLRQSLVQWMQALAKTIREEVARCRGILDRLAMGAGQPAGEAPSLLGAQEIVSLVRDELGSHLGRNERDGAAVGREPPVARDLVGCV